MIDFPKEILVKYTVKREVMSDDYGGCTTDFCRARLLYCGDQKIPKGESIELLVNLNCTIKNRSARA